ncbi:Scr1 family TA system antitoxin-like transcriptional regulator [Actinomadura chokoriensis]|uniref:Scr1 family TA system antitoxin-like transcriptional regulator n=1 Tax=Actinomadura chokoriensis TaxID=454156 RepID=UPI003562A19F
MDACLGGPIAAQLRRLLQMAGEPHVSLRIVPFSSGANVGMKALSEHGTRARSSSGTWRATNDHAGAGSR